MNGILNIKLSHLNELHYKVRLEYLAGDVLLTSESTVPIIFTEKDQENLRWYLEDYPYEPFDPSPSMAAKIEERLTYIGQQTFDAIFGSDDPKIILRHFAENLKTTDVRVYHETPYEEGFPMELIKDPAASYPLFLHARSLSYILAAGPQQPLQAPGSPLRILLIISRPAKFADVPFRSVSRRLVESIGNSSSKEIVLEALRPPTFQGLKNALENAAARNQPYTMIHFDGHGTFIDLNAQLSGTTPKKFKGYLLFENPALPDNIEYMDGKTLGRTMVSNGTNLIILNACRSAQSRTQNLKAAADNAKRSFSSLAEDLTKAGINCCLAMRYNIQVDTASSFMFSFYTNFSRTYNIRESVALARQVIFAANNELDDWIVPVLYESHPGLEAQLGLPAFPICVAQPGPDDEISAVQPRPGEKTSGAQSRPAENTIDVRPYVFGMDKFYLDLEDALLARNIIGVAGGILSGKTLVCQSFADWYTATGGAETTFVIDAGQFTGLQQLVIHALASHGTPEAQAGWPSDKSSMIEALLTIFLSGRTLVIIDNFDVVSGLSLKYDYAWSADEAKEMDLFLQSLDAFKIKTLLITASYGSNIFPAISTTCYIQGPDINESVLYIQQLLAKDNYRTDLYKWKTLIEFAQGSYWLLQACTQAALARRLDSFDEIEELVQTFREGDVMPFDSETAGLATRYAQRLREIVQASLSAEQITLLSCAYPYKHYFDMTELEIMGGKKLDKDAFVFGYLEALGLAARFSEKAYILHPLFPFVMRKIYDDYGTVSSQDILQRFIAGCADLAGFIYDQFIAGDFTGFPLLTLNRFNLWFAFRLALANGQQHDALTIFLGLVEYYEKNGRSRDIKWFLSRIEPFFLEPDTLEPLTLENSDWKFILEARTRLEMDEGDKDLARRLLEINLKIQKRQVAPLLVRDFEKLTGQEKVLIDNYYITLSETGVLLMQQRNKECVQYFLQCKTYSYLLKNPANYANACTNLGTAYEKLFPDKKDLAVNEFYEAFDIYPKNDKYGRGLQLIKIAEIRVEQAYDPSLDDDAYQKKISEAYDSCKKGLALLPSNADQQLSRGELTMGKINNIISRHEDALKSFHRAILIADRIGQPDIALNAKREVISTYIRLGNYDLALEYAEYVTSVSTDKDPSFVDNVRKVIENIQQSSS